jgi:AcrR family transcriptional regulator
VVSKQADFRRARRPDQKQDRRERLLEAARDLLDATPYAALSMAEVAEAAGVAKGTLYLYVRSKEELVLAVLDRALGAWFDDVAAEFDGLPAGAGDRRVAALLTDALLRHERAVRLLPLLHGVLEQNVTRDVALDFKRGLARRMAPTAAALERALPHLPGGGGAVLLLRLHALTIGVRALADPAPVVRDVLEEPGLEAFRVDFGPMLAETLTALLTGLRHQETA